MSDGQTEHSQTRSGGASPARRVRPEPAIPADLASTEPRLAGPGDRQAPRSGLRIWHATEVSGAGAHSRGWAEPSERAATISRLTGEQSNSHGSQETRAAASETKSELRTCESWVVGADGNQTPTSFDLGAPFTFWVQFFF
jgi:hypothetical protein